jgi:predicted kinase
MGRGAGDDQALVIARRDDDEEDFQWPEVTFYETAADAPEELEFPAGSMLLVGGVPGVGKTHLLERLAPDAVILNADSFLQEQESGSSGANASEGKRMADASWALKRQLTSELEAGRTVIVDAPGLFPKLRAHYKLEAEFLDREAHALFIEAPVEEIHKSQEKRGRVIDPGRQADYEEQWDELREQFVVSGDEDFFDSVTVVSRVAADGIKAIRFK